VVLPHAGRSDSCAARIVNGSSSGSNACGLICQRLGSPPTSLMALVAGITWPIRTLVALSSGLVIVLVAVALFGTDGVARHEQLRSELQTMEQWNQKLSLENKNLRSDIDGLRNDRTYIESVIREELGFITKDDIVLILPKGATVSNAGAEH
jgi:cell division protein FtsB